MWISNLSLARLWLVIAVISIGVMAQGQSSSSIDDSIKIELAQFNHDTARISWILKKARTVNLSTAKIYVQEGLELAGHLRDSESLAELLTEDAILNNRSGDLNKGLASLILVDSIVRVLQDTLKLAAVHTNIGLTQYYLGNLDQALLRYHQAYQLHKYLDQPTARSRLLNNLAMANKQAKNFDLAQRFYHESLTIKKELKDSVGSATTLMNLGLLLSEQLRINAALDTLELARDLYRKINRIEDAMDCQLSLGKVMLDAGQPERAQPLILESYNYFRAAKPGGREHLLAAGDMASLLSQQNQWVDASPYLREAIELSRNTGMEENLKNLLKLKAKVDYNLNQYQASYEALEESYRLNDTLNQLSKTTLVQEMQARFDLDLKEQEIELLNMQNNLKEADLRITRNQIKWLIGIGVLLVLFSIFLYALYAQIKKQKSIIDQALKDKDALMKEIHHRVKNNLQVISSLLSMQSFQMEDSLALEAVQESQNRVKSMSLIHQKLYQNEQFTEVDSKDYIENLCLSLFNSYNVESERINLETHIESIQLDVDTMIPIGLILNELITNALKYAFSRQTEGTVQVVLQNKNAHLHLSVKDNGIGLPQTFDENRSTSMGYQLINDFVRKLRGTLEINSQNGTHVSIEFPYIKPGP